MFELKNPLTAFKCSYFFAHIKAAEACKYVKGIRKTFVRFALNQKRVSKEICSETNLFERSELLVSCKLQGNEHADLAN